MEVIATNESQSSGENGKSLFWYQFSDPMIGI